MTDLEAANRALTLIGVAAIADLDGKTEASRVMTRLIPDAKKNVLADFPWTFALREAPLVLLDVPPSGVPAGYGNCFLFPADAVNINRVFNTLDKERRSVPFQTINAGNVQAIAAAAEQGSAEYMMFVSDLALWRTEAIDCLAHRLASDAAVSLNGSPQLSMMMLQKYSALLNNVKTASVFAYEAALNPANSLSTNEYRPAADHYIRVRR